MKNLNALIAHEAEDERINAMVETLARAVAEEAGVELRWERGYQSGRFEDYFYDSYKRTKMDKYRAETLPYEFTPPSADGTVAATGERLIAATFQAYIGDSVEDRVIYFPETYLDDLEWRGRERGYAEARRRDAEAKALARSAEAEAIERAQYEALHARFGAHS
jgi:hypothetical protein